MTTVLEVLAIFYFAFNVGVVCTLCLQDRAYASDLRAGWPDVLFGLVAALPLILYALGVENAILWFKSHKG